MKSTMKFSVGGETVQVPQDEVDEFNGVAKEQGVTPEPIYRYRVNKLGENDFQTVEVPKSQYSEFARTADDNGYKVEPVRLFTMDDGSVRDYGVSDANKMARSQGFRSQNMEAYGFFKSGFDAFKREIADTEKSLADMRADDIRGKGDGSAGKSFSDIIEESENGIDDFDRMFNPNIANGRKGRYGIKDTTQSSLDMHLGALGAAWDALVDANAIKRNAENGNFAQKAYAYASDLANSIVSGFLGGSAKVEQAVGTLVGSDAIVQDAAAAQEAIERNLPTDMLDTKQPGVLNKVLDVGKGVASVTGEFAPAAIPGVGAAYAPSLVGSGATIRYKQIHDEVVQNGGDEALATGVASLGATVDAGMNMMLMGTFKGIWKGEQAQMAELAKQGLVRRLVQGHGTEAVKTGLTMASGGMAQDILDQAVEGQANFDWRRNIDVGKEQFVEGGLFHLVNAGAHNMTKIKWSSDPRGIPAGAARDMLEAPEGRALVIANSPEAAVKIMRARERGEDVSRSMIEGLGVSRDTAPTVKDRNAIGDRIAADYRAFKERVRTKMDDVQAAALSDEINSRSDEGIPNDIFEKAWFKAVEQIKDACELDDPDRRREIVDEALKHEETKGERLSRLKAVKKYNVERAAEQAGVAKKTDAPAKTDEQSVEQKEDEVPSYEPPKPEAPVAEAPKPEAAQENAVGPVAEKPVAEPKKPVVETAKEVTPAQKNENTTSTPARTIEPSMKASLEKEYGTAINKPNFEDRFSRLDDLPVGTEVEVIESADGTHGRKYVKLEEKKQSTGESYWVQSDSGRPTASLSPGRRSPQSLLAGNGDFRVLNTAQTPEKQPVAASEPKTGNVPQKPVEAQGGAENAPVEIELSVSRDGSMYFTNGEGEVRGQDGKAVKFDDPYKALKWARANGYEPYSDKGVSLVESLAREELDRNGNKRPTKDAVAKEVAKIEAEIAPKPESEAAGNAPVEANGEGQTKSAAEVQRVVRAINDAKTFEDLKNAYESFKYKGLDTVDGVKVDHDTVNSEMNRRANELAETTSPKSKPSPKPPSASAAKPKTVAEAVRRVQDLKDELEDMRGVSFTGKDAAKNRAEHEAARKSLEKRIAEAEAEVDSFRTPAKPFAPYKGKPDAKKAAKVAEKFVLGKGLKENSPLESVYHDKENGVAVATEGHMLIATKHGFDPNAKEDPERVYPTWRQVVPKDSAIAHTKTVNPAELEKACGQAVRLSKALGHQGNGKNIDPGDAKVAFRSGKKVFIFDARIMSNVSKAMDANGISDIGITDGGMLVARNGDTTIVAMGVRTGGKIGNVDYGSGRVDSSLGIVVDADTGRVVSAPTRTDERFETSRRRLKDERETLDRRRKDAIERGKRINFFNVITEAQKKGITSPQEIYDAEMDRQDEELKKKGIFEKPSQRFAEFPKAQQDILDDIVKTTDPDEIALKLASYGKNNITAKNIKDAERAVAKLEKRIADEDALEELLMRGDEARAFLGIKNDPKAKKDKPASAKEPHKPAKEPEPPKEKAHPSLPATRKRIKQANLKFLSAEKLDKDAKKRIQETVEHAAGLLTEEQAARLAAAMENEWRAGKERDDAERYAKSRDGRRFNASAKKEIDAHMNAVRELNRVMEELRIEQAPDGEWVIRDEKGDVVLSPGQKKAEDARKKAGDAPVEPPKEHDTEPPKASKGIVESSIVTPKSSASGASMSSSIYLKEHINAIRELDSTHDIVEVVAPPAVNKYGTMYVDVIERVGGKNVGSRYYVDSTGSGIGKLQGGTKDHLEEWKQSGYYKPGEQTTADAATEPPKHTPDDFIRRIGEAKTGGELSKVMRDYEKVENGTGMYEGLDEAETDAVRARITDAYAKRSGEIERATRMDAAKTGDDVAVQRLARDIRAMWDGGDTAGAKELVDAVLERKDGKLTGILGDIPDRIARGAKSLKESPVLVSPADPQAEAGFNDSQRYRAEMGRWEAAEKAAKKYGVENTYPKPPKPEAMKTVEDIAGALAAKDTNAESAAMERLRESINLGRDFPDAEAVAEAAKALPEDMRKDFTENMDAWRRYAERVKETPSIAERATRLAEEVDAEIAAEEAGAASPRRLVDALPATGGKTHEFLRKYLSGGFDSGKTAKAVRDVDASPAPHAEGKLLSLARKNGEFLGGVGEVAGRLSGEPFPDGEKVKHGMETIFVVRDGNEVVKFRRHDNSTDHEDEKVSYHNELFPDTAYTFGGFAEKDGRPISVLRQRYVDIVPGSGNEARAQLLADMKARFGSAEMRGNEIHAGGWMIDDLKDANIGIDRSTGKYAVVDCTIHRVDDMPARFRWKVDGDMADADQKPDAAPRGRGTGQLDRREPESLGHGTKNEVVTPRKFIREMQKLFPDVAIRAKKTVRMPRWADGHYEPLKRIVRGKQFDSIVMLGHELGHELEYITRYDLARTPAAKRDLSDLGHHLYPPGGPKPNSWIGEGFADYVGAYIRNEPRLPVVAPDLHRWFTRDFAAKHPEVVKKLDRLRDMVQTMEEQSACQKIRASMEPETGLVERAWKKVTDFFSNENFSDANSVILKGLDKSGMKKLLDWQSKFRESEAARKAGNTALADSLAKEASDLVLEHPFVWATASKGTSTQRSMEMAVNGTQNLIGNKKTGESIRDIFRDFTTKEVEAWKEYALARTGIENYYDKKLEFGIATRTECEEAVAQHDSPKFRDALDRITEYSNRILHLGVDAGLMSEESYRKIVDANKIYVRVTRRNDQDGAAPGRMGGGGTPVKARSGGFSHVEHPIAALLEYHDRFLRACFQAKTLQLIANVAKKAQEANRDSIKKNGGPDTSTVNPQSEAHYAVGAYWPVEVPNAQEKVQFTSGKLKKDLKESVDDFAQRTGADRDVLDDFVKDLTVDNAHQMSIFRDKASNGKDNLVSVYIDGKLHTYELPDKRWINMFSDIGEGGDISGLGKISALMSKFTSLLRLGATQLNLDFAVRNTFRDSTHAAVMSDRFSLPFANTINGIINIARGGEASHMFDSMGGEFSSLVGVTKMQKWEHGEKVVTARNALEQVKAYGKMDWILMKPFIKAFGEIMSIGESAPRKNEMQAILDKCRDAGMTDDSGALLAFNAAKDITVDFQRSGYIMRKINRYIPFINAAFRGTEQTIRNFGLIDSLPHQFNASEGVFKAISRGNWDEAKNAFQRGGKTVSKAISYVSSIALLTALAEMDGDEKERRAVFERTESEKWDFDHLDGWRFPVAFEVGALFGAPIKALVYEAHGDEGALKEALSRIPEATFLKYLDFMDTIGSVPLLSMKTALDRNEDHRGRPIVPDHIKANRQKKDWYTQYTTETSKRICSVINSLIPDSKPEWQVSPARFEYAFDSLTGGLFKRIENSLDNIGDSSRLKDWRNWPGIRTLRDRPQANRLVSDFYNFEKTATQKEGSGVISLEEFGKLSLVDATKKKLTDKFNEMRKIRADKSVPLAEQDERVLKLGEEVNDEIRAFNANGDFRQVGIASAANHLTSSPLANLDEEKRKKYMRLLKDVDVNEAVNALIRFGHEPVMVRQRGVEAPHHRWSDKNINDRVMRLIMLMQDR